MIVYGGNSAAIIAAVQVVQMGKTVIVVSPDTRLGACLPAAWALPTQAISRLPEGSPGNLITAFTCEDGEIKSFTHIFSKPGNNKVYFSAVNATINDRRAAERNAAGRKFQI